MDMKNLIKIFMTLLFSFLIFDKANASNPTYLLTVSQFIIVSPNTLDFDIRLQHTNPDSSVFLYSLSQYILEVNPEFANGGNLSLTKLSSELPEGYQPYNLSVSGNQLRFPGGFFGGDYYTISTGASGTLIIKARLRTTAASFFPNFTFRWVNGPIDPITRIKAFVNNFSTEITDSTNHIIDPTSGIINYTDNIPDKYSLSQNYPNPFNPETNLEFGISELGFVTLKIYNSLGLEVAKIVNETLTPGTYNYQFSTINYPLSSGVYLYRLEAGSFVETKRMVLLK